MIEYTTNKASADDIIGHLFRCDADFIPALSSRVNVIKYAMKLFNRATRFEAWSDGMLVALLAVYEDEWFITNVSVLKTFRGNGIAGKLLKRCVNYAVVRGAKKIALWVGARNRAAIFFYQKHGFYCSPQFPPPPDVEETAMFLHLLEMIAAPNLVFASTPQEWDKMTKDTPTAKYAYSFDFEVMHPLMIRTFELWFRLRGQTLELGSFEGAFTRQLSKYLLWAPNSITCVEASAEAFCKHARSATHCEHRLATFENVELFGKQFDNIFMTHVLEHVEDPVRVLKRVNDEWLAPGGRFFLAVPNAHAASRQIAFHMGLLKSLHGVTIDEYQHGHHRTYTLDMLECHARNAGLKVIARGGIFFKALANFQIDRAKAAGIIDDAYLEGCYQLGQVYPDLCASIYLICEKGEAK